MSRLALAASPLLSLALAGCSAGPAELPAPIDLRAAIGAADPVLTGVAVTPGGRRFVFDEGSGLYELHGDTAERVLARDAMPDPGQVVRAPFTDLVALDEDRFAITAIGDGYYLDLAARTMRPYFCYVPDGLPEEYDQRTDAVTYDDEAGLLYAQPRTFDAGGDLLASQVASYSFQTGADLDWVNVAGDVAAGGMVKLPGVDGLFLGVRSGLCHLVGAAFSETIDLQSIGVISIEGLAVDQAAGTLLVLDGQADRLHELPLASLVR